MAELVVRLVVALGVVLGLVWFLYRVSQKRLGGSTALVSVVGRQAVGRNSSVTVVSVSGRVLVLGVSEHQVQLLTELDPSAVQEVLPTEADPTGVVMSTARRTPTPRRSPAVRGQHAATVARSQTSGSLGGSVLSAQTWREAWAATRGGKAV